MIGGGAGGSRCTTPANSLGSRKSPTNDQGVQAGGSKRHDDKRIVRPIQPPGGRGDYHRNQNQHHQRRSSNSRERRDSRGDGQVNKIYLYSFCLFYNKKKTLINNKYHYFY